MKRNKVFVEYLANNNVYTQEHYKHVLSWMDDMQELADKHILANLPHGSGIDGTWLSYIDFKRIRRYKFTMNKLVCTNSIHCLNENGYYDGWIDFSIIIPITGNCLHTDKLELVAHGWRTNSRIKKYWSIYTDWLYDTIMYAIPTNPLLVTMEDLL